MRKISYTMLIAFVCLLSSCEEFGPAFTDNYSNYKQETIYKESDMKDMGMTRITISDLKAVYESVMTPVNISENWYIKGQVVSSDSAGNFYKSIFIQDETSGIEIKFGKYNLFNEYRMNQWVYVKLRDLTVGAYYGSVQVGFKDESGKYETSYIEVQRIIDTHVFRGEMGQKVQPATLTEDDLKDAWKARCCGTLVKLNGLTHAGEIFCLLYRNPALPSELKDKNHGWERVFLSGKQWGVTTWAMSENKFEEYLNSGIWDTAVQAAGEPDGADGTKPVKTVAEMRANNEFVPSAYTVSQYFKFGDSKIGVRSSGYAKFSDLDIDPEILNGQRTVNMTGVITYYSSSSEFQFTISSIEDVEYVK